MTDMADASKAWKAASADAAKLADSASRLAGLAEEAAEAWERAHSGAGTVEHAPVVEAWAMGEANLALERAEAAREAIALAQSDWEDVR